MDRDAETILNHAFVRVYRAFGQYVREACIQFDVGAGVLQPLLERQRADAERLGTAVAERFGAVYNSTYPIEFGDLHFLNCSHIVGDWVRWQRQLVAGLETDHGDLAALGDPGLTLIDEILRHERQTQETLEELERVVHVEPATV